MIEKITVRNNKITVPLERIYIYGKDARIFHFDNFINRFLVKISFHFLDFYCSSSEFNSSTM